MTNNSVNVCRYSYAAAAIGIVAALVTACAMVRTVCDSRPLSRLPPWAAVRDALCGLPCPFGLAAAFVPAASLLWPRLRHIELTDCLPTPLLLLLQCMPPAATMLAALFGALW